ncbi:GntR family transcriptional regulator [Pediococcus acidilactici]
MDFDDKIPIYYQIKQYIYQEIIVGHFPPGSKIPAVRQFAVDLTVNVNTMQRALRELIQDGILVSQRGKGNFVTEDQAILQNLRQTVVEKQLSQLYDHLLKLQIEPDEMLIYLSRYITKRKDDDHEKTTEH